MYIFLSVACVVISFGRNKQKKLFLPPFHHNVQWVHNRSDNISEIQSLKPKWCLCQVTLFNSLSCHGSVPHED